MQQMPFLNKLVCKHKALIASTLYYLNSNYRLPVVIDLLHFEENIMLAAETISLGLETPTHVHSIIIKHL